MSESVATRLGEVRERIAQACARTGRDPASVTLVAVSKFHSIDAIREAYAAGQREFGESYAQELVAKAEALRDLKDIHFRFIGALQTNKAKALVQAGCSIDSLANESGARALANKAAALDPARRVQVLLQVNVAEEPQKSGVSAADVKALAASVRALPGIELAGLMTIPKADDPEDARRCFRRLRELAHELSLTTLSMGMSDDLEIAIEEGSTMVRVGTAIFGPRPQP